MSIQAPNYTQIPNELLTLMPEMKEAELRVTLAIARKTFGWHKREDRLSYSQLMQLTGLSRQGVVNGIEDGLARGTIHRDAAGDSFVYSLCIDAVNEIDQTETGGQRSRPQLVNVVDTQKKNKEINNNNNNAPAAPNDMPLPASAPPPQPPRAMPNAAWFAELESVIMVFDAQSMFDLSDAWAKFPDARRHNEAMRQLQNARMRTSRVYLKAFLNFNPDWKPPTNEKASADRSKKPIPPRGNGHSAPAAAHAPNAPPLTNAERLAQWKAARIAAGMDTRGVT